MTQTSYFLAIDLGTSRIAAATARVAADGSIATSPFPLGRKSDSVATVVFAADDGDLSFGDVAERRGVSQPERLIREFKRSIGDEVPIVVGGRSYPAEQLYAQTVAEIVRIVTEREGAAPEAISLTHPTAWGGHRLDLVRTALSRVGIDDVELITEPEAAARHYEAARPLEGGGTLAVYDLGGGTFDCVVLRKELDGSFGIIGEPVGIDNLGGADFDDAVLRHVVAASSLDVATLSVDDPDTRLALSQMRRECVDAKEALSFDSEATIPVLVPPQRTTVRLTRSEFEDMITPSIERTVDALDESLESASLEPEQLESILLIGGSSRIPRVAQLLSERFDRPIAVDADPKAAIALGAARTALVRVHDRQLAPSAGALAIIEDTPTELAAVEPASNLPAPVAQPSKVRKSSPFLLAGAAAAIAAAIVFASTVPAGSGSNFTPASSESTPTPSAAVPVEPVAEAPAAPQVEAVVDEPSAPEDRGGTSPRQSAQKKAIAAAPPVQTQAAPQTARPTTPPAASGSNTTPTNNEPTTPPADPGPTTPPADPGPTNPPVDPGPTDPPVDPGPTDPPVDPGPTDPPVDPGPTDPPVDPAPTDPPADPTPEPTSVPEPTQEPAPQPSPSDSPEPV